MERLDIISLALAGGILWGTVMALAALTAPTGWNAAWVDLWASTYVGYGAGAAGAVAGFVWGFADAVIGILLFVGLYRGVRAVLQRRRAASLHPTPRI